MAQVQGGLAAGLVSGEANRSSSWPVNATPQRPSFAKSAGGACSRLGLSPLMDATGRTDTTLFLPPQGPCAAPQGDFGDIAKDFICPRIHARSLPGNDMLCDRALAVRSSNVFGGAVPESRRILTGSTGWTGSGASRQAGGCCHHTVPIPSILLIPSRVFRPVLRSCRAAAITGSA